MYEGLGKVFWGIFFATFNIKLGFVKILPAFVGFIIISDGINTIYRQHKYDEFKKALDLSRIVILITLFGELIDFFIQGNYHYSMLLQIWPVILMIAELLMFYYFFIGIVIFFQSIGNEEVSERVMGSSRLYLIIFIIVIASLSFILLFNMDGLNALAAILIIILRISLMVMVGGLKKELMGNNTEKNKGI